jgi:DNA gyrase/topoisomerase IV subunit B
MNINESLFLMEDIIDISPIGKTNMYDIQVMDDETFVLSNGLLSHNSAKSMVAAVRNPEIHGALPLRGKILNVRGELPKTIIENQIISDIMTSLGVGLGQPANRRDMRYGSVYLAADQDPDGANITALLVNFFYLHWPELFDPKLPPVFYVFQTPFIIQEKGKKRTYWYADDYHLYNADDWKGAPKPTRAKGLGSLEEIDWIHSLSNPRLIPLTDDGALSEALDLIFNASRADDRKAWVALSGETADTTMSGNQAGQN